ncbi:MAG: family 20 glycosylhydrolase [Bacteroidales bacterium]
MKMYFRKYRLQVCFCTTIILFLCAGAQAYAQCIIPSPQKITYHSKRLFVFDNTEKYIRISIDTTLNLPTDEAYTLSITKKKISIVAKTQLGVLRAKQSMRQLMRQSEKGMLLPDVSIEDYPAFPIRGFMLDNGRNFMELSMLKHYLDLLAMYKINVFHWHLTDHPGWRIECRIYPQLNAPQNGIPGRDEGRFYTYNEIRELIHYARERGITIIPEIDMPGHSLYFEKAFGFSMDSPDGMRVLEQCLTEFFNEIPAADCPYFHVGSDEIHIADPAGFMHFVEGIVSKNGREILAWDPGLPGSESTIRQIWSDQGLKEKTLDTSKFYIDSYMGYLNYYDPILFSYRMMLHNTQKSNSKHLGGILCLWNDVHVADKSNIAPHNGFLNGLLPFAECFWTGDTAPFSGDPNILPSPESAAGYYLRHFENCMLEHRDQLLKDEKMYWVASSTIPWLLSVPRSKGEDTSGVEWIKVWGGAIEMDAICRQRNIKSDQELFSIAKTKIFVSSDTSMYAWVGFEAPARSNRISGGIGREGQWENGGELRVNGTLISPPKRQEPGAYAFHFHTWGKPEEMLPYTDEQLYWMRAPVKIELKKGWNSIEIKSVKTFPGQRWSFSFIPLSIDNAGRVSEVKGVIYTF